MTTYPQEGHLAAGSPLTPSPVPGDPGEYLSLQPRDRAAGTTTRVTFGATHPENAGMQTLAGGPPFADVTTFDYRGAAQPEMHVPFPPDAFAGQSRADGISPAGPGEPARVTPVRNPGVASAAPDVRP
jgi:hypothetical protein